MTKERLTFFHMNKGSVFGDYQVIFGLKSNIIFSTPSQKLAKESDGKEV